MPALVSMVGSAQDPSRAAAAAWRSWFIVRGSSTSSRRGFLGSALSVWAMSTSAPRAGLDAAGVQLQEAGDGLDRHLAQRQRRLVAVANDLLHLLGAS